MTVELKCYTASEYKQAVTLAQSSREQIDILNTVNLDFSEEVEKGSLVPLDDLIASVDGLKDILPDWLWELGSVDGQIYMVPNYQRASNMNYLVTPTEWLEKYGDAEKIEETLKMDDSHLAEKAAVLEEYVRNVQAGEGATHYMPPMGPWFTADSASTILRIPFTEIILKMRTAIPYLISMLRKR